EVLLGLAAKAHDNVRRDANSTLCGADANNFFEVLLASVPPPHPGEDLRRARLHWQVYVVTQRGIALDGFYDLVSKVARVGGGKPHAPDTGNLRCASQQFCKVATPGRVPVRVDVLPQKLDLSVALVRQTPALGQDFGAGPAPLRTACHGHHAIGTVFVATLDDRQIS